MNAPFWKWISEDPEIHVDHHCFVITGYNNRNRLSSFCRDWTWHPKIKRRFVYNETNLRRVVVHDLLKIQIDLTETCQCFNKVCILSLKSQKQFKFIVFISADFVLVFWWYTCCVSFSSWCCYGDSKTPPDSWLIWSYTCFGGIPLSINSLAFHKIWSLVLIYGFPSETLFFALPRQSVLESLAILEVVW